MKPVINGTGTATVVPSLASPQYQLLGTLQRRVTAVCLKIVIYRIKVWIKSDQIVSGGGRGNNSTDKSQWTDTGK